jgi:predicted P-loop ATPase
MMAVYAEERPKHKKEGEMVSVETRRLIEFLNTRYVFRFNTVMGYTEYRPNNTWIYDWTPCDENVINGMTIEARLANLDAKDKDVRRYVHSNMIRKANPVDDYLFDCHKKWDGKTDHIAMLAKCVPCQIPQWETWFKKWFVYMVAQWMLPSQEYGNSVVPLLISPQGDGKTSFCRMILPKELRWGFLENLDVSEKRSTLQAMHNFLLINLDEFNQISPKLQEGFLKNVIQLPSVKIKRPYGRHVEEFKRQASFIATTNETNVLSDPTGSRRFICVNLTAPIDTNYKPNYEGLYGQAYDIVLHRQMDWWFSPEEVKEIMEHNRQYQVMPPAVQYFNEYYEPAIDEKDGEWQSPTAIYDSLRKIAGSGLKANGVAAFGRHLWNMPELQRRRIGSSRQYLVKKKKPLEK